MGYPIERKFVIAVSSSALFDMTESDAIFRMQGEEAYKAYQGELIDTPFTTGVAFPFIKRLLALNNSFPEEKPIEVVLFSKNSPETGLRAFRSIRHYGLDITRAYFSSGKPNHQYLPAFNSTLFLTSNIGDARVALENGITAGVVGHQDIQDSEGEGLCLAFDFDGVIADDSSEQVYEKQGLQGYLKYEEKYGALPLKSGPVGKLLQQISFFQKLERRKQQVDPSYRRLLRTVIVTARNAPAHERVVFTLLSMDVEVDDVFFMGGIDKSRVLNILRPHIFFDDQTRHLENLQDVPGVHIPFGTTNKLCSRE